MEELDTNRGKRQSTNEELITVNRELTSRIEALSRANSDLQNLIASIDIGMLFLDPSLCVKRFTPRLADVFDISLSDMGRPCADVPHRLDCAGLHEDAARVLRTSEALEREVRSKDGRVYLVRLLPCRTAEDEIDGVVVTFIEITRHKRAREVEAALAKQARQQAAVAGLGLFALENPDLQALMDRAVETVAATLDAAFCKVLELQPDGRALLLKAGVGWREGLVGHAVVGTGQDSQAGFTLRAGEPVVVEDLRAEARFSGPPLLVDHGVVSGVSVIIRRGRQPYGVMGAHTTERRAFTEQDVHFLQAVANLLGDAIRRKRAEAALRKSEWQFRRAITDAPYPVVIHAEDGEILQLSKAWTELSGYTLQDIPTVAAWTERAYGARKDIVREEIDTLYALDARKDEGEYVITTRDGSQRTWDFHSAPLGRDAQGHRLVISIASDVTERKQAEEHLRQAKEAAEAAAQAKSAFMAHISHDLRTPLTAMLGFAQLLGTNPAKQELYKDRILKSGERLKNTIDAVLDFVRLEGRSVQVNLEPLDLVGEAQRVLQVFELQAAAQQLDLVLEAPEEPVWANLDQVALGRVLTNLIGNALKFTPKGRITVTVAGDATHAALHVRDTGIGISEAFLPRVFEVFEQESSGDTRAFEGNGLGLAIARRLVEAMGGEITVASRKGEGSTFTICFDRLAAVETDRVEAPARGAQPRKPKRPGLPRVLVVEDNAETREMLAILFEGVYEAVLAGSIKEAMQRAQGRAFDLLVLDINLGRQRTGVDLLRILRALPGMAKVPAIACTAYALPADEARLLEAGFTEYVPKPFDVTDLTKAIGRVLARV